MTALLPLAGSLTAPASTASTTPLTTASTSAHTSSLFAPASAPRVPSVSDRAGVEVGVEFSARKPGVLTEIAFYKGRRNTGTQVGRILDDAGHQMARVTFAQGARIGWQRATFPKPLRLVPGKRYRAVYLAPRGGYARDVDYFTSPMNRGDLSTPSRAGVYRYTSQHNFRRSAVNANYWVDVRFRADRGDSPSAGVPASTLRDKYTWPFAATSIWNMPVGAGAAYKPLNLTAPATAYGVDEVYLPLDPAAPFTKVVDRGSWWPYTGGSTPTGTDTGVALRIPTNWVLPPPSRDSYPNRASAALQADGKAREFQYTVRPQPGSAVSMSEGLRAAFDLAGSGLTGNGQFGAHGGSGMTAIGGTIRVGELSGSQPIRHALAFTFNMRKWGTAQGGNVTDGHRWPAIAADAYYAGADGYGSLGSSRDGLGMGSLLALPSSVDITSLKLETPQGRKVAWTLQNYGAYIVDDSYDPGNWDVQRINIEADAIKEFPQVDTYPGTNTPFGRDMNKIYTRLALIDNNGPSSVGGGGHPRQPLAGGLRN